VPSSLSPKDASAFGSASSAASMRATVFLARSSAEYPVIGPRSSSGWR
jgi:hypothetical protein